MKLRASWGINGNDDIGLYQYISTIDKSPGYIFGGEGHLVLLLLSLRTLTFAGKSLSSSTLPSTWEPLTTA
jgi:phage-related holin